MVHPKHIDKQTADGTAQNLEALYQLFPSCFTEMEDVEGKVKRAINWGKLRELLGDNVADGEPEVYDFTWVGKRAAQREAMKPIRKTLRPCPEESVNWDTTQNLYIEGDNLEVLKLLQNSYMGKVKMIYIDPPYNTGNDFVYHDDFHRTQREEDEEAGVFNEEGERMVKNTESNGKFHSDWCSMIYSRLLVARSILSQDGVLFISIDDNELENLLKICTEVFGADNYVGTLSVENNPKGRKNSAFISVSSEYCVIFAKEKEKSYFVENVPKKASDMTLDENGRYVHNSGKRVLVGENSFNSKVTKIDSEKNYSVYYRKRDRSLIVKKEAYGIFDDLLINSGYKKYYSYYKGVLVENTYTEDKFKELFNESALEFASDKIYEKNFSDTIRIKSQLINREYEAIVRGRKEQFSMELTTTGAGSRLKNIFKDLKEIPFQAPKNTGFLKMLITLFPAEPFYVLDFFSGSSSTADAVMQLNSVDGGKRKYIMVQWPEDTDEKSEVYKAGYKNICEIGKERIRRAGKKIKEDSPLTTQDLDIGFRVFKCDDSNFKDVTFAPKDYSQESLDLFVDNIKEDRTDLDLLFDCMLRWGVTLDLPMTKKKVGGCTIHNVNEGALVACFDGVVTEAVIDAIAEMYPAKVVFRDSSFEEAAQKMNIFELFKQKCGWDEQEVRNNIRVI